MVSRDALASAARRPADLVIATTPRTYHFVGGAACVDFVNTVADRGSEPREDLGDARALTAWARARGLIGARESMTYSARAMDEIRAARELLYALFVACARGRDPASSILASFNSTLARVQTKRRLERRSDRFVWSSDVANDDVDRLLGPLWLDAVTLLERGDGAALRACADPLCGWLFVDRSRANRRRWCRMADCGNRAKARRFSARRTS